MVVYVPAYRAFVDFVHSSEQYQDADDKTKNYLDGLLDSQEIKERFTGKFVPQLTLYESLILGFLNSDAMHERTSEEQQRAKRYLTSGGLKEICDDVEEIAVNPLKKSSRRNGFRAF